METETESSEPVQPSSPPIQAQETDVPLEPHWLPLIDWATD